MEVIHLKISETIVEIIKQVSQIGEQMTMYEFGVEDESNNQVFD